MIVCPNCGKENQDHYKFCLGCGAKLPAAGQAAPPPQPPSVIPAPVVPAPVGVDADVLAGLTGAASAPQAATTPTGAPAAAVEAEAAAAAADRAVLDELLGGGGAGKDQAK